MSLTGSGPDDPQRVGVPIADLLAGMYGAYGVLAALMERERTGRGQVVRTSLLAAIVGVHASRDGVDGGQARGARPGQPPPVDRVPYGLFHCASVQLSCGSEAVAQALRRVRLRPGRPGMATNGERVGTAAGRAARSAFADISAEDLLARLAAAGIPAGKVRTIDEVYSGTRPCPRVCWSTWSTHRWAVSLPGPPLRFFQPGPDGETETTRRTRSPGARRRRRRDPRLAVRLRRRAQPAGTTSRTAAT